MKSKKALFDPTKSFFQLPIVKWTFVVSGAATATASTLIILFSDLLWEFSYHGFNHFTTVFKVPLGLLLSLIPFVALLATNHRSEQTKEVILQASSQNNFVNHFKHLEEFEKYYKSIRPSLTNRFDLDLRRLHQELFPDSKHGVHSSVQTYVDHLDYILDLSCGRKRIAANASQSILEYLLVVVARTRHLFKAKFGLIVYSDRQRVFNEYGSLAPKYQKGGPLGLYYQEILLTAELVFLAIDFDDELNTLPLRLKLEATKRAVHKLENEDVSTATPHNEILGVIKKDVDKQLFASEALGGTLNFF